MDLVSSLLQVGGQMVDSTKSTPQAAPTGLTVGPDSSGSQSFQAALEQAQKRPPGEAELALVAQNNAAMLAGLMGLPSAVQVAPPQEQARQDAAAVSAAAGSAQSASQPAVPAQPLVSALRNAAPLSVAILPQGAGEAAAVDTPETGMMPQALTTAPAKPEKAAGTPDGAANPAPGAATIGEREASQVTTRQATPEVTTPALPGPDGQVQTFTGKPTLDLEQPNHLAPPGAENPADETGGEGSTDTDGNVIAPPSPPSSGTDPITEPPATDEAPGGIFKLGPPPVGGDEPPADEKPGGVVKLGPPVSDPGGEVPPDDGKPGVVKLGPPVVDPGDEVPPDDEKPGVVKLGPPVSDADHKGTDPLPTDKNRRIGPPVVEEPLDGARLAMPTGEPAQTVSAREAPVQQKISTAVEREVSPLQEKRPGGKDTPQPSQAPPENGTAGVSQPENRPFKTELARLAEAHQPETVRQISQNLENLSRAGHGSFRLQLDPQDLGRIDLRFTNRSDGLHVVMAASLPETGAMLERNLMDLRHSLTQMGVQVGDLTVSYGQANEQQAMQQHSQHNGRSVPYSHGYAAAGNEDSDVTSAPRFKTSNIDYLA